MAEVDVHNGESPVDTALREAVTQGQWTRVAELLKQNASDEVRRWSVEESVKHTRDGQLLFLLPHCADDQAPLALKEAVTRRMWGTVSQLLARDVSDDIRRWAVKEAIAHACEEPLASVLLHCSDDQVAAVLTEAVHKHQWTRVGVLLARGVTEELAAWVMLEASKHATEDQLLPLLSYCPGEQTDTLLTQAGTRHLWSCVFELLSQGQPSDSVCGRAVGEASKAAAEWQLLPLLQFCPDDAYHAVLVETLRRGCWQAVDRLLEVPVGGQRVQCAFVEATEDWDSDTVDTAVKVAVRYKAWMSVCHLMQISEVSDDVCQYVIEYLGDHHDCEDCGFCVERVSRSHTDNPVLPQKVYSHDFVKMVLEAAVSRKLWNSIVGLLPHNFITSTIWSWLVEQTIENADDSVLSQVLVHCTDSQLDLAVETAVTRRLWPTVLKLLSRNISDATRAWAVDEAIQHSDDKDLKLIICHCTDMQLGTVLKEAIRKGFWHCVVNLCCRGKYNGLGPWIVEEVSRHASTPIFNGMIRLLSIEVVPDVVLRNLLERDAWDAVQCLFSSHRPSETHLKMILQEASKSSTAYRHQFFIESLCTPDLVEAVLPELLNREEWEAIIIIECMVTAAQRQTIVQEASKRAAGNDLETMMHMFCTDSTVDLMLPNILQRDQWGALLCLVDKHITDGQRHLVVNEACKRATGLHLHFIIKSFCTKDLVASILPELLQREEWLAVSSLKQHSLEFTQRMMIVQEACKHATGDDLCAIIKNFCTKDMVESVLPFLLERDQWGALLSLVTYQVTTIQQCQIILAASKRADETSLTHFVRHCPDVLLESVTTEAVQRGLWKAVVHLLSCRISNTLKKWTVDEAMKHAEDEAQFDDIVTHCTTDQLEQAVTTALGRRYWAVTERLLKRGVDSELVQRAVEEATEHADEVTLIRMTLGHSNRLNVDPIIVHAVNRDFWRLVKILLEWSRSVGSAARQWAVEEALKRATDEEQMSIFPHCSDDQVNSVLTEAVKKGFWSIVLALLERGASIDTRRMAVAEGLKHADLANIVGIIPHCTDDQLDMVLTEVVNRCLWICVPSLLSRSEVTEITRRWVVGEARKNASSNDHFLKIVPFCTDDQVDSIVTGAVSRNLWQCVSELLRLKNVTESTRERAVEKASERAEEGPLLEIIHFCTDDQVDSVLTQTVHRQLWRCASELLRLRNVTDSTRRLAVEEASKNVRSEDQLLEIVPFCTDDQADSVLMETVTKSMWRCVELLLKLSKGTDYQRKWAMWKAMDLAPEQKISTIFAHCDDDNLVVEMFQKIVERGFVSAPNDILDSGLTDHKKQVLFKAAKNLKFHDSFVQNAVRQRAWTLLCFMLENTEEGDEVRQRNVGLFLNHIRYLDSLCSDDEFSKIIQHCHPTQLLTALVETVKRNQLSTACDIVKRMGRRGDPLATTDDGDSVLVLAMKIQDGLRQLVAECIKLGLSTHQPDIEANHIPLSFSEADMLCRKCAFRHAALKNDVTIANMLYESGACSSSQLYKLHADFAEWNLRSDKFLAAFGKMSDFLEKMTSTPRSLQSACRLVISHRVGIGSTRQENVKHLPLPETLKNYMLFSDVTKLDANDETQISDVTAAIDDVTAKLYPLDDSYYDSDDLYLDSSDDYYGYASGYDFDSSDEYSFGVSHDTYDTAFYDYFSD